MSDTIVVWRAWILWPDSRFAKGALLVCMCGSVGGDLPSYWEMMTPMKSFRSRCYRRLRVDPQTYGGLPSVKRTDVNDYGSPLTHQSRRNDIDRRPNLVRTLAI